MATALRASVLVEVMVAIVMLGVFLGALSRAFQGSIEGAVALRAKVGELPTSLLPERLAEAWSWGAMVDSVEWDAGPELTLTPGPCCEGEVQVGIWADGWFLGEWPMEACEQLRLDALTWEGLSGSEVLVRVRKTDGGWGAPWRTVVPDSYGHTTGTQTDVVRETELAAGFLDAGPVMHLRNLATPELESSWSTTAITAPAEGSVLLLGNVGSGICTLECDERTQSWIGAEGRQFDIFW